MNAPISFFRKNRVLFSVLGGAVLGLFLVGLILHLSNRKSYFIDGHGVREEAKLATVRQILWETPELLEGLEGIEEELYDPAFGADGGTLVFNMGRPGKAHSADLFSADNPLQKGWSEPQPLGQINGPDNEIGANLSADGSHLFFFSDREGGYGGYDIWFALKQADGQWSVPVNAGPKVNTAFNEYDPAYDPYSDTLFFASNRPKRELTEEEKRAWLATQRELVFSTDYDIFISTRVPLPSVDGEGESMPAIESSFETAKRVDYLNTSSHEGQISLTPRGDFIYFASNREGGHGGFDIYRARIIDGQFRDLENIGTPVNSSYDEMDPALTQHGYVLVLSSNRPRLTENEDRNSSNTFFTLYESTSREVFVQVEQTGLESFLGFLKRNFWWLLLLVIAIVGILYLLRLLRAKDVELGMTTRALLGSLLFHAVLALLLSLWFLTYQIIESTKDPVMEANLDTDTLAQEQLALEIRERVTEMLPAVEETIPVEQVRPDMPVPTYEPEETPIRDLPPEAFTIEQKPVDIQQELPEPVRRELPREDLPTPEMPQLEALASVPLRFRMEQPQVEADNTPRPKFQEAKDSVQLTEQSSAPVPENSAQPIPASNIEIAEVSLPNSFSAIQVVQANPPLPTLPEPTLPRLDTSPMVPKLSYKAPVNFKLESEHNVEAEVAPEFQKVTSDEPLANVQPLENALSEEEPVQDTGRAVQEQDALAVKTPIFEAKLASQESERPVDNLPAFENRPTLLQQIPTLEVSIQLESDREITAEDGVPQIEDIKPDASVAKSVELDKEEFRPELPEIKVVLDTQTPREALADIKVDVETKKRPVSDKLPAFKDDPLLLDSPILPMVAGITLEGERDVQSENSAPEIAKISEDASVAQTASLDIEDAKPVDAKREVAIHDLPTSKRAEPLLNLKPLDYQPTLPELSGPDNLLAAHLPTIDLSTKLLLETQPVDTAPYLLRDPKMREKVLERLGGNKDTEKAVGRALNWFTRNQEKDGRWSMERHGGQRGHDIAATSFAVLCYFGWGIKHDEPGKFQKPVKKALKWLVENMGEDGNFTGGQHNGMYDQGVATMALAEAYGLTKDPDLREPLERAVQFVIEAQHPQTGAWDYRPRSTRIDTSVSGWQLMALKSAHMADVKVDDRSFKLSAKWLDTVGAGQHRGIYGYDGRQYKTEAMVATGLFCQQLLGVQPSHRRMQESIQHMQRKMPSEKQGDFYYWYYACLSLYQNQGPAWDEWNERMKPIWLNLQVKTGKDAGSWDARGGRHMSDMGRVITTALATLSLEVYYRYLPLYQERAITLTMQD